MIYKQIPYINTFKRPIRAEGANFLGGISTFMNPPPLFGNHGQQGGVHIIAIDIHKPLFLCLLAPQSKKNMLLSDFAIKNDDFQRKNSNSYKKVHLV